MAGKSSPVEYEIPEVPEDKTPDCVKTVNLGLPSRTKWADMNLGATEPKEGGYYFAWGDTIIKAEIVDESQFFNWENYCWMTKEKNSQRDISKYQLYDEMTSACWFEKDSLGKDSFIGDNRAVLLMEDDAAQQHWGGYWRMPTYEDFLELTTYCTTEWVSDPESGTIGCKFTSKINGQSIFFPAAGYWDRQELKRKEVYGYYWSATLNPTYTPYAQNLYISQTSGFLLTNSPRYYGYCIRPVRKD